MAGEKADIRHFDLKQMENFRDHEVQPVYAAAKKHREQGDGAHIRPLSHLTDGHTTPENLDKNAQLLNIGKIAREDLVSGSGLVTQVKAAATAIDTLLGSQMDLFQEMLEALTETIAEANKTKGKNLDAINAQLMRQTLSEVYALTGGGLAAPTGSTPNAPAGSTPNAPKAGS
ncbi:type VII secretion system-associated protein [Streptomyces sp. NPDC004976]